jgi:hypothetical protein
MVARSHSRKPSLLRPLANVAYQATRIPHTTSHPARLDWDISLNSYQQRNGRHSIPTRLRPPRARVRLNSLFKLLSFSGDAERDSLKSLSQVCFTHRGYPDSILVNI